MLYYQQKSSKYHRVGMVQQEEFKGTERFSIIRRLGSGSFGVVYLAYDQERHTQVALKTLHRIAHTEDAEALYRFKREFRSLADVTHPNLVALYELISDGEEWFFTMELVRGVSFTDFVFERGIKERKNSDTTEQNTETLEIIDAPTLFSDIDTVMTTDQERALQAFPNIQTQVTANIISPNYERLRRCLRQLAEGVCALHAYNRLHRDIKPSNVMVTLDGRVVILDFGLVTELISKKGEDSGIFAGTPTHMSPEQAAGWDVSEASDWYSVGVILYEALTNQLPFTGSFFQILKKKQVSDPPAPIDLLPETPIDLNNLCMALLQRDPIFRPTGLEILNRLRGVTGTLQAPSLIKSVPKRSEQSMPMIGREKHLAALQKAYQYVVNGDPVLVYLHGSSGMGKSMLARRFFDDLEQSDKDLVVLSGRCYEQESVPYKAFDSLIDALSQYLKTLSLAEAEDLMPRDVQALARLFPVLLQVDAVANARRKVLEIPDSQELRRRAFTALRELLARLSDKKTLVLYIDDLQWGDVDSAALLAEILRPPHPPALMLLASYRSEDVDTSPPLRTLLALRTNQEIADIIEMVEVVVGELSNDDALILALELLGENRDILSAFADVIVEEAGGSPFFIDELVRYSPAGRYTDSSKLREAGLLTPSGHLKTGGLGITTLDNVLQSRIKQLPDTARRLLEVIAVAGQPVDRQVAKKTAELGNEEQSALALLRTNHFVRVRDLATSDELETYHDRIRETIVNSLPRENLQNYHLKLALELEKIGSIDAELLANHFSKAGSVKEAAQYMSTAASQAYEALAFDHAARLYRQAIELEPTSSSEIYALRRRLGNALANAGRSAEAAQSFLTAANETTDTAETIGLQRAAAEQLLISGHMDEGFAVLRSFLGRVGIDLPETPRQTATSLLFKRAKIWLRGLKFKERNESEIPQDELIRIDTCWAGSIGLGIVDTILGADFQARHMLLALNAGEPYRIVRALAMEIAYSGTGGSASKERTAEYVNAARDLASKINHPHAIGLIMLTSGIAAFLEGRWKDAADFTAQAEALLREHCTGTTWEIDNTFFFRLRTFFWLGDIPSIFNELPVYLKDAQERGDLFAETNLRTRVSYVAELALDEPERAFQDIQDSLSRWSQQKFHIQHYLGLIGLVDTALYQSNWSLAEEIFNRQWPAVNASMLMRIQHLYIESLYARARIALTKSITAHNVKALLNEAEQNARLLEKETPLYSQVLALIVRAAVAFQRKDYQRAIKLLLAGEEHAQSSDMKLILAALKYRRGKLLVRTDTDNGQSLIDSAESWMLEQKIKNPARMVTMIAPGF